MTASPDSRLRIVLGENHADLATMLALLLDLQPDMCCAGHAASCSGVLELADAHAVGAYVLDLALDDGSSIALVKTLRARYPDCVILVYSGRCDAQMTAQCLQAGADATLLKDGDVQALLAQLRALALQR
jgi:two-component system response regulator DesR